VELLENHRLARQRHLFLALLCPVVRNGKAEAGSGPGFVLVVELARFAAASGLRFILQA
jgi:hypothetical protein